MIGITINGQHLQLFPDISYDVTENSALYSETLIEENSVYNFPVPRGYNDALFGFPGRLTNANAPAKSYECAIFLDNNMILTGTAVIKSIKEKYIDIAIALKDSGFYFAVKDKKITDYNYPKEYYKPLRYFGENLSICNVANNLYPESNFALFPVKNLSIFDETKYEEDWRAFDTNGSVGIHARPIQNTWKSDIIEGNLYYFISNITPFPYVGSVLDHIFSAEGYTIEYNIIREHNYLRRLCIYNPNFINYRYPNDPDFENLVDYEYSPKNHLPQLSVTDFIAALKGIGISMIINDVSRKVIITTINDKSSVIKRRFENYKIDEIFIPDYPARKVKLVVNPDETDSYYSANVKPDQIESGNYRGSFPLYSSLASITDARPNDIAHVNQGHLWWMRDCYYIYQRNEDDVFVWEYLAYDAGNKEYFDGDELTSHNLNFSFMWTRRFMEFFYNQSGEIVEGYWHIPEVGVKGNYRNEAIQKDIAYRDFGLKLAFYLGFCETSIGTIYPLGTSDIFDEWPIDIPVENQKSLIPNHTNPIYEEFLMEYFRTISKDRKIKILKSINADELNSFNFIDEYYLEGRNWKIVSKKYRIANAIDKILVEMDVQELG